MQRSNAGNGRDQNAMTMSKSRGAPLAPPIEPTRQHSPEHGNLVPCLQACSVNAIRMRFGTMKAIGSGFDYGI